MLELYEIVFRTFLLAWFFTNFDPITTKLYSIEEWLEDRWIVKLLYPLQCFKCLTFWSVLFVTNFNVWLALTSSFIASLYDNNNK